jgi:hypothetical protein
MGRILGQSNLIMKILIKNGRIVTAVDDCRADISIEDEMASLKISFYLLDEKLKFSPR